MRDLLLNAGGSWGSPLAGWAVQPHGDTGGCWRCWLGVRVVNGELFWLKSANRWNFLFLKTFTELNTKMLIV